MKCSEKIEDRIFKLFDSDNFNDVVAFISEYGSNARDRDERNLLMNFIIEGKDDFAIRLIQNNLIGIAEVDSMLRTALHYAVLEKRLNVIQALVDAGADINARDIHGNTPLFDAIFIQIGKETLNLLIDSGGDIMRANNYGAKPADYLS